MSYSQEKIKEVSKLLDKVPTLKEVKLLSVYSDEWLEENKENLVTLCVLDLESTGISFLFDEITEIACRQLVVDKTTGQAVKLLDGYNGFNEPSDMTLLTDEIQLITGITPEMVKGQKLDWDTINKMCNESDYIVAHNAGFDSKMLKKYTEFTAETKWLCSQNDVNWYNKNLPNRKLEVLCPSLEMLGDGLGFNYSAHRAINDVDATIQLLINANALKELITPTVTLQVRGFVSGRFYKMFFEPNRFYFKSEKGGQDKFVHGQVKEDKVEDMKKYIMEVAQKERDNDTDERTAGKPLQVTFAVVPFTNKKY